MEQSSKLPMIEVCDYIKQKYNIPEEKPWAPYLEYVVYRHEKNRKMFAIIMNVKKEKLGFEGDDYIYIVSVKLKDQSQRELLLGKPGFMPEYHSKLESWISILLDGSVTFDLICAYIDESYEVTVPKERKKKNKMKDAKKDVSEIKEVMIEEKSIEENVFMGATVLGEDSLIQAAFQKEGDDYVRVFEMKVADNLNAVITINPEGVVTGKIMDTDFNDEYLNWRNNSFGTFSSSVKEEYEQILMKVRNTCFEGKEKRRCDLGFGTQQYHVSEKFLKYHDTRWCKPEHNDQEQYAMLILEGVQAGLSWPLILEKEDNYREAFDGFDPAIVATYDDARVEKLMQNEGIIRNRSKIKAAITNAQAFLKVQQEFESFDKYIWGFTDGKVIDHHLKNGKDMLAQDELSERISKDLKKRGFKFVGPTIVYSYLQGIGIVNDHWEYCEYR